MDKKALKDEIGMGDFEEERPILIAEEHVFIAIPVILIVVDVVARLI